MSRRPRHRPHPHLPPVVPEVFENAAHRHGFDLDVAQRRAITPLGLPGNRSLYLWGPPGRGKSWLTDTYFAAVGTDAKIRIHFHEFFRDLHTRIRRHRHDVDAAIDHLFGGCELVCFDEFHVHDPADGKFVARMLPMLLDRGTRLILTSNYEPSGLLPNPYFHDGFTPTIDLIRARMHVVSLDGGLDHRSGISHRSGPDHARGFAAGRWIDRGSWTDRAQCHPDLAERFGLTLPQEFEERVLSPAGRPLRARRADDRGVWFDFADLCCRPTAPVDYLALADRYPFWVVDAIPELRSAGHEPAQRFANLVDVLHDRDIPTIFVCDVPVADLEAAAGPVSMDFGRITSRLRLLRTGQDETSSRTPAGRSRVRR